MNTSKVKVGDYDLRIIDPETRICGEIHDTLIDAARRTQKGFNNGFPNWWLYRSVIARDLRYDERCRDWIKALALCMDWGRKKIPDEVIFIGAELAFNRLSHPAHKIPYTVIAEEIGCHRDTLKKIVFILHLRLKTSMDNYVANLIYNYELVQRDERREDWIHAKKKLKSNRMWLALTGGKE